MEACTGRKGQRGCGQTDGGRRRRQRQREEKERGETKWAVINVSERQRITGGEVTGLNIMPTRRDGVLLQYHSGENFSDSSRLDPPRWTLSNQRDVRRRGGETEKERQKKGGDENRKEGQR